MLTVVKRRGHEEPFDSRKIYGSVYAACRAAHCTEPDAEEVAANVCQSVATWVADRPSLSSDEIFRETAKQLDTINHDASFLYETHRDIS